MEAVPADACLLGKHIVRVDCVLTRKQSSVADCNQVCFLCRPRFQCRFYLVMSNLVHLLSIDSKFFVVGVGRGLWGDSKESTQRLHLDKQH